MYHIYIFISLRFSPSFSYIYIHLLSKHQNNKYSSYVEQMQTDEREKAEKAMGIF